MEIPQEKPCTNIIKWKKYFKINKIHCHIINHSFNLKESKED
jgi:hypothetical protein